LRIALRLIAFVVTGAIVFAVLGAMGASMPLEVRPRSMLWVAGIGAIVLCGVVGWAIWSAAARLLRGRRRVRGVEGRAEVFDVVASSYREATALAQDAARRAGYANPEVDNWSAAEGLAESTPWTDGRPRKVRVAITEGTNDAVGPASGA
jgi:hypothetical protein